LRSNGPNTSLTTKSHNPETKPRSTSRGPSDTRNLICLRRCKKELEEPPSGGERKNDLWRKAWTCGWTTGGELDVTLGTTGKKLQRHFRERVRRKSEEYVLICGKERKRKIEKGNPMRENRIKRLGEGWRKCDALGQEMLST